MKTMKIWRIAFAMLAAFSLASCRQSAQKAEAEQQADSTEAVTNTDTLQLVIGGKESAVSNSAAPVRLKLPLDSVVIEMVNNTDIPCITGEWYTIEHWVNDKWETVPIKPRKDGLTYGFDDIAYGLAPPHIPPLHHPHTARHVRLRAWQRISHRQRIYCVWRKKAKHCLLLF